MFKLEELLNPLVLFGFAAQFIFMLRFIVQWWASEQAGRSVVPVSFWYLSLVGGVMLLTYAVARRDPVFSLAQALSILIYVRNLVLIHRHASAARGFPVIQTAGAESTPEPGAGGQGAAAIQGERL